MLALEREDMFLMHKTQRLAMVLLLSAAAVAAPIKSKRAQVNVALRTDTPYALPKVGEAIAIGVNTAMDIVPTEEGWSTTEWGYSLFNSFGGGAFVPRYSQHGAYVITAGGHSHPDNTGAAIFDFSTATWVRLDNANGVKRPSNPTCFATAEAPFLEVAGTQVPTPPHPYSTLAYSPEGAQGSVMWITRMFSLCSADGSTSIVHRLDLATKRWSRVSDSRFSGKLSNDSNALWDEARDRYWYTNGYLHEWSGVPYFDRATSTWKSQPSPKATPTTLASYKTTALVGGLLVHVGTDSLYLFDPDDAASGWVKLKVSGTLSNLSDRWAQFSNGNLYSYAGEGGNSIDRIRVPADPKTGTWQIDQISISGVTLPAKTLTGNDYANTEHYTRFFYVPSLDCIAWIPGGDKPVYLLRPGS